MIQKMVFGWCSILLIAVPFVTELAIADRQLSAMFQ
ncbi:hypothetical protein OCOJLMKI_3862 [Methylobacterium iners]|uniref:Uncharacterized protein n=1 Tax=Methylobacterium iners TaxID=418707 RepID=A0ABQ4S0M7_9HYPH|nr:hypothetical protein OCOJLMKI_3862 [Methylobacterium iners]